MKKTFPVIWFMFLVVMSLSILFLPDRGLTPRSDEILLAPSLKHLFGTDQLGRNYFFQVIGGAGMTLFVGLLASAISLFWALLFGLTASLSHRAVDQTFMKLTSVLLSLPQFILIALVMSLFVDTANLLIFVITLGSVTWFNLARLVRAQARQIKSEVYIEAAQSLGATQYHIARYHLLPGLRPLLLQMFIIQIPSSMTYESFLSLVGLSLNQSGSSWGGLIAEGWKYLYNSPHLVLAPTCFLVITIWSVHVLLRSFFPDVKNSNLYKE